MKSSNSMVSRPRHGTRKVRERLSGFYRRLHLTASPCGMPSPRWRPEAFRLTPPPCRPSVRRPSASSPAPWSPAPAAGHRGPREGAGGFGRDRPSTRPRRIARQASPASRRRGLPHRGSPAIHGRVARDIYEVGGRFCLPITLIRVMGTRRKYLALDIETAKLPEGDGRSCRPLGIRAPPRSLPTAVSRSCGTAATVLVRRTG